jgi:hypothetical protein
MKYIAIFPNTDPTLDAKICIASANIEADTPEEAGRQCTAAVPAGWPILVYEQSEYDNVFHSSYEPDFSVSKLYGTNQKIRNNFLAMGYTEEF